MGMLFCSDNCDTQFSSHTLKQKWDWNGYTVRQYKDGMLISKEGWGRARCNVHLSEEMKQALKEIELDGDKSTHRTRLEQRASRVAQKNIRQLSQR